MKEAKNNEKMAYVIQVARADSKVGERLAANLIKSKTAEDVADAFADAFILHQEREN
jgi:hypothetical protein